jgi:hypothetical protein
MENFHARRSTAMGSIMACETCHGPCVTKGVVGTVAAVVIVGVGVEVVQGVDNHSKTPILVLSFH